MMVDINNSKSLPEKDVEALAEDSGLSVYSFRNLPLKEGRSWEDYYKSLLVDPHTYYQEKFAGKEVFRYVQTHPDMDHMSGLHRFFWQERVPLSNFWDVAHSKECDESDFESSHYSYLDWLVYKILRSGHGPKEEDGEPNEHKVLNLLRDDSGSFWEEDGIEILSPTDTLIQECDKSLKFNNCSYVLRLSYGGRKVILPGDAERPAWQSILDHCTANGLQCDILKAAHHGRQSGFHQESVNAMAPTVVICSVGKKPSTDASSEYARVANYVLSTRYNGSMKVTIWHDGDIWVQNHKGERIATITE